MMRGGTASIFRKLQFTVNNRQLNETFNASKDTIYGFMVDANNLYGGVMQTHKLPARHFKTIGVRTKRINHENKDENSMPIEEILATPDCSDNGYFVEIDLKYPQLLHESHCGPAIGKVKKLSQTLHDKTQYIVHYKLLKLYVKLGYFVTKLSHCKVQTRIMAQTVHNSKYNTKGKRQKTSLKKPCTKIKILREAEETMRNISKFEFETYKKFSEDMAALILAPTKIRWDIPTIVGACILELAEFEMYNFPYEVMKPNFICHLLYSDFDSLMYEIKTEKIEFL